MMMNVKYFLRAIPGKTVEIIFVHGSPPLTIQVWPALYTNVYTLSSSNFSRQDVQKRPGRCANSDSMIGGALFPAGLYECGGNLDNTCLHLFRIEIIQSGGLDNEWFEEFKAEREGIHGGDQKARINIPGQRALINGIDKNFLLFIGSIGNGLLCVKNILPQDVGYGADDRVEGTLRHPSF